MDAVRFGRALGFGARQAVKTLTTAVDAATSESPSCKEASPGAITGQPESSLCEPIEVRRPEPSAPAKPRQKAARTVVPGRDAKQGLRHGGRRFREAALRPFVRLSGVVALEVAGVFFGVFALYGLGTVWRLRGDWHADAPGHRQLLGGVVMLAIFGYFCVSSFVRARRRERGR
jgi:hypothetical protein